MRTPSSASPAEVERMNTSELRSSFLVDRLFEPGALNMVYTELDRLVIGGAMPAPELVLGAYAELGTRCFTERRELGVVNLGDRGSVVVDGTTYEMDRLDGLYVGSGDKKIAFRSAEGGQAAFYLCSSPAHRQYPIVKISSLEAVGGSFGDDAHASRRTIRRYIHQGGAASCQLVMGVTTLETGSVWNTMPAHTHPRRTEIYLYFDLGEGAVIHLMGQPDRTRHLVVRDREAALSPAWSIHSGTGTNNYSFVWAMGGENQDYADANPVPVKDLF